MQVQCSPFAMAGLMASKAAYAWPDADIQETKEGFTISLEIPGAARDDIKIWLENNTITISGEKKKDTSSENRVISEERTFGNFQRAFRLPQSVDRNNIKARFVDGVLIIGIPKAAEAQGKTIAIN